MQNKFDNMYTHKTFKMNCSSCNILYVAELIDHLIKKMRLKKVNKIKNKNKKAQLKYKLN